MRRRAFLKQTALGATAGAAALALPAHAQEAPVVTWRLASSFPNESPTLYAGAEDVARYVSEVTDGRFSIVIAAGEDAVPTGQVLQAVRDGVVECGHTASTRYFDIDPALSFDAGVPFGLNTRQMHAWMTQGEGLALTRVLFGKHNILNFPAATPARRWAAGFAARSRPSMICAA